MPRGDRMRAQMVKYLAGVEAGDVEAVVSLFADSISVEDPVGGPPGTHVVGIDAVRVFFREGFAASQPRPRRDGPIVTTAGDEAAMAFTLYLELEGGLTEVDVIDVMRFDEEAQIISLRAFWNFRDARHHGSDR